MAPGQGSDTGRGFCPQRLFSLAAIASGAEPTKPLPHGESDPRAVARRSSPRAVRGRPMPCDLGRLAARRGNRVTESHQRWTREAVESLGLTTDVPTAGSVLGISQF